MSFTCGSSSARVAGAVEPSPLTRRADDRDRLADGLPKTARRLRNAEGPLPGVTVKVTFFACGVAGGAAPVSAGITGADAAGVIGGKTKGARSPSDASRAMEKNLGGDSDRLMGAGVSGTAAIC